MDSLLQIAKSRDSLMIKKPLISRATKPEKLSKLINEIENSTKRFKLVATCLTTKTGPDENEDKSAAQLVQLADEMEKDIFLSGLDPKLIELYDGEYFSTAISIDDMKSNLELIIGTVDPKEEEKRQIQEFNAMSRRVELNESFASYLKRLKTKANALTKTNYANKLVEVQFANSLRDMDQSALDFHALSETGITLVDRQAELLDKMNMFKKKEVKVNSIQDQVRGLDSKLTEWKTELKSELLEVSNQRYEKLLGDIDAKLNKLDVKKTSEDRAPPPNPSKKAARNPPKKKPKKFNKEDYCFVCGLRGHNDMDCKGRPDMICILCDQPGHVASSRKFHGQSKN